MHESADMLWKYHSEDDIFEILLGPVSLGSVMALARRRVTYVLETPVNKEVIDACWKVGAELNLYEMNRCKEIDPGNHQDSLENILQLVENHYQNYKGIVVHGIGFSESLMETLVERRLSVIQHTDDGFVASLDTFNAN